MESEVIDLCLPLNFPTTLILQRTRTCESADETIYVDVNSSWLPDETGNRDPDTSSYYPHRYDS
ncbi:hypothetical protein HanXRQr2_Chr06g0262861 [Helianthus annuus]|uniref:Uncharacterized protein n=1 Tax=Helianthus annuus TaxID=4232 RepID=A0A9K3ITA7_HELAN|nr:hypothetical protein HanXRQr2_Chr06g0262861 [Helianthus annuus]